MIEVLEEVLAMAVNWGSMIRGLNSDRETEFFVSVTSELPGPSPGRLQQYLACQGVRYLVSRVQNPPTNGKLERLWGEYDRHRLRFATLREFIDGHHGRIHDTLWTEMYKTWREAFQCKLPAEVLLDHFSAVWTRGESRHEDEPSPTLPPSHRGTNFRTQQLSRHIHESTCRVHQPLLRP